MRLLIALAAITICSVYGATVSYEGYKTYRVVPATFQDTLALRHIEPLFQLDFWSAMRFVNQPVDIMVKPEYQYLFEAFLRAKDMKYEITIENVETSVQRSKAMHNVQMKRFGRAFNTHTFHSHAEINAFLDETVRNNPDIATVQTIGQSYEGRNMNVIKLSTGGNGNKPVIFIDGGIHAREWAAPAEVLCIIDQLVNDPNSRQLLDNVDWYILPSVNPDGYEYTRRSDRFWRKTRSPGKRCFGADPNRNFDFHWMEVGASSDECSETYGGKYGFSEIESLNVAKFIQSNPGRIQLYLTFHSYGQYILYPWGYTSSYPSNVDELDSLGEAVNKAISSVYGTEYTVGSSTNTLYPAAGGSDDWAMGVGGVPLTYTIELPAGGSGGFDMDPSQIQGMCTETLEGIKVFHEHVVSKRV